MRRVLAALVLASRLAPAPSPSPILPPPVPDPPFLESAPKPVHLRSPEASVFAAYRPILVQVVAPREEGSTQGSGFVIHPQGLILTNNHVVWQSSSIRVRFSDGRDLPAHLAGADPALDLAVLKVEAEGLTAALLGDSDRIEEGDPVLALGMPLGLGATITRGILSGKERRVDVGAVGLAGSPVTYLQTDAAINAGSSGGPLVDLDGAVVGVTCAVVPAARGISFAVPINVIKRALPGLLKNVGVARAFLGLTLGQAGPGGAEVVSVRPGGPADRAGVRTGDVVTMIRGKEISSEKEVAEAVKDLAVHETVSLQLRRRGNVISLTVTAVEVPVPPEKPVSVTLGGATVAEFGPESKLARSSGRSQGVVFAAVPSGSGASRAGIKSGDVLLVVGMDSVGDLDDLRVALDRSELDAVKVYVWRAGEREFTAIVPR